MIKVLINGTPIYRLEFHRRKYKTLKRKNVTAGEIKRVLRRQPDLGQGGPGPILEAIDAIFEHKPLYETTALIYIIDAKRDEPPVATATTRQSRLDDNRKSVGREVALGRLLNLKRDDGTPVFTDLERAAIRAAYDNRSKTPRKPLPPAGSAGFPPIAHVRTPAVGKVLEFVPARPSLQLMKVA